jgi:RNA polymerase sigma-70 factor (ECF subfamily)
MVKTSINHDRIKIMVTKEYVAIKEEAIKSGETDLIANARRGDLEAFNHLVLQYQDRIFNLAARILGDEDMAGDVTQTTFLAAYQNLAGFRNGSFQSWLYRIATNACYDQFRQQNRHPVASIQDQELGEENFLPLDDYSSHCTLPEKELERHELERVVQQALNQLAIDMRNVVILVDMQDIDYQEAAQILHIPVGTVKSRLARGRQRLRQLLNPTFTE